MSIFDTSPDFPYMRWVEGFFLGIIAAILISLFIPSPEPKVVEVPKVQVIEKPVVVKKPVYVTANDRQQIQCLAENAYYEAGNQTNKGMIAVTNVVMNRVKDSRFPKTPCAVVHQRARGVCQFSWVCEGGKRIRDGALFARAKQLAEHVYIGNYGDVTNGATFYHANYVNPGWRGVTRVTQIGAHIFYRG